MSLLNQRFKSKTEKDAGIKSPCERGFMGSLILEKIWPLVVRSKTKTTSYSYKAGYVDIKHVYS